MTARVVFVLVATCGFVLDRVTKALVLRSLEVGERVQVVDGLLELRHVQNRGIAFGLFADAGSLVLAGTLVVGALLFWFMLQVDADDVATTLGASLIAAGALGNLVDRVRYGYVIDFLHLPNWPTFNVADMAITAGVVVVLIGQLAAFRAERRAAGEGAELEQPAGGEHPR